MDYAHPFLKHQIQLAREFEQSQTKFKKHNNSFNYNDSPYRSALDFMGFSLKPNKESLKKEVSSPC